MQRLVVFSIAFFLAVSCSKRQEQRDLYPIDSLLTAQANYLTHKNALLTKTTILGDKQEEASLKHADTLGWKNELEIFAVLDQINKPTNKIYYLIEDHSDSKSNLSVRSFSTKQKNLPIEFLKLYYHGNLSRLRKIEARFNEQNTLYKSARDLSMEFQELSDAVVLTSYEIAGGQKIFLDDSVEYNIRGKLTMSN